MQRWHGSWSRSATISGFRVKRSRLLRWWRACLLALWGLAVVTAPLSALVASLMMVVPAGLLRGRTAWSPRRLDAHHLRVDVDSGTVVVAERGGNNSRWTLTNWLRHPWLVVLYLEVGGSHAMVVLAPDSVDRRDHRRLRYLLGVRTVGPDSEAVSG